MRWNPPVRARHLLGIALIFVGSVTTTLFWTPGSSLGAEDTSQRRFDFGDATATPAYLAVGPASTYSDERGHPRLRMRHMPFSIGIIERDQWLACMDQAMGETGVPDDLRARLRTSFFQTADWMRNRGE